MKIHFRSYIYETENPLYSENWHTKKPYTFTEISRRIDSYLICKYQLIKQTASGCGLDRQPKSFCEQQILLTRLP